MLGDPFEKSVHHSLRNNRQQATSGKNHQDLLSAKLISCANVIDPIASLFHWGEKVEQAEEFLVMMKSRLDLFEKLSESVTKLHSYKVPEIIAIPIIAGSKSYLDWLENTLR